MEVVFTAQPHADGRDLRDFLTSVASDPLLNHLDVVVAWAKRSGLSRVRGQLEAIRSRPGTTRVIVGIDEGGATRQGLDLAREIFSSVYVFHDSSWRTFHPKIYLAYGADRAQLLVGSNNLTAGGVYFNYEAALQCKIELPADELLLTQVQTFIDKLLADSSICFELTDDLYAELTNNPLYRVRDEDAIKPKSSEKEADVPEDVDSTPPEADSASGSASVFGTSSQPKRSDPSPRGAAGPTGKATPGTGPAAASTVPQPTITPPPPMQSATVIKRWFKKLSASDARHPPSTSSHVTGVLRLVQARHPINQTNYFRDDFFVLLAWTGVQRPRGLFEETTVAFRVIVDGTDYGVRNLRVDHAPWREAGQGNHTTVLHWDDVAPILDSANYTNYFVVLERLSDGSFRLEIVPSDPGAANFIA
jgi:hypothetical protein